MSIHPSLKATKGNKLRSVLKRYERIEKLKKDGKWVDDQSAYGLIKGKVLKIKLKKSKSSAEAKPAEEAKDGKAAKASKAAK